MPGVFPDYPAPVVRPADGGRELVMMRWGMPPTPTEVRRTARDEHPHHGVAALAGVAQDRKSMSHSGDFSEYAPEPNPATGKKDVVWFAFSQATNGDVVFFTRQQVADVVCANRSHLFEWQT
jgi:hypothetical protein